MIDFLNSFKSLIKLEKIHTDNNVFKLHYKFTVILLIVFSILLTSKQYFGDPIDCQVHNDKSKSVIDTYCWIFGTYIIKKSLSSNTVPGLGNYPDYKVYNQKIKNDIKDLMGQNTAEETISQKYYQWVCILFCFQALLFYIPRYLWKTWEGGRLRLLIKDLGGPLISNSWNADNKERLILYMISGRYSHNAYALRYAFCELLNFLNVISQILLLDWFLTGHFAQYGINVLTSPGFESPMTEVFPKLTKCTYYSFGLSGTLQSIDALCILPLNVVNEKLFLFLWFWLFLLSFISFVMMIYRILLLTIPLARVYVLMAQGQFLSRRTAWMVVKNITFGDFFLLYQLGKNLNPLVYKELVLGIAAAISEKITMKYSVDDSNEITVTI